VLEFPAMIDVFLCHNTADTEDVEELANRLKSEGISVWMDRFNLIPGERFTEKIEEALDACNAIAVFVGRSGRSPYQNEEFEYSFNTRGRGKQRIIPVLLPGAQPEMITGFLASRVRVQFKLTLNENEPLRLLIAGIKGVPPGDIPQVRAADSSGPSLSTSKQTSRQAAPDPYRPLTVFDVDDHDFFCGRDALIAEGLRDVEAVLQQTARCFFIIGASGSGKSSLARAGLVWGLKAKYPNWTTVILEPGPHPHEALAERMLKLTQPQVDGLTLKTHGEAYLKDTGMLQRSVSGALGSDPAKGRLLLLVDQFEEVFTVCENKAAADAFIDNLLGAGQDSNGKTIVLICMRADFYENCARTPLAGVLKQQLLVGPMSRDELRSAIRDPAVRAGCDVEPALIDTLVRDCDLQPSPLPLLEIALEKLWARRNPQGMLTLDEYQKMSFEGAIDEHAEGVYGRLTDDRQRKMCLALMLQLAEPIGDGRYARRRVPLDSLLPATDRNDKSFARVKAMEKLLGVLSGRRARLVAIRTEGGGVRVEIAHEAIFRGWKRLAAVLDQDGEFLLWKRRLAFAIADWKDPKTAGGYLSGGLLSRAVTWLRERPDEHSEEERRFISGGVRRRLLMRIGQSTAVAGLAAGIYFGAAAITRMQRDSGVEQTVHLANELLSQAEPNAAVATLAAYDAMTREKSRRTREVLQRAVQSRPPLLEANSVFADVSLRADGGALAAALKGAVLVWTPPAAPLAWSPDSIAAPRVFDFPGDAGKVSISRDGNLIAAGDDAGTLMIWRDGVPAPAMPLKVGSGIAALAIAADGRHLAAATSANEIIWWNTGLGKEECRVNLSDQARALAVSPDASSVAAGSGDGFVRFWKPPAKTVRDGPLHDEATLTFVGYTRDGNHLGSGTRGGKAYFQDLANPTRAAKLTAGDQLASSVAMDEQGSRMASYTSGGSLVIFDLPRLQMELEVPGLQRDVFKIDLSADGRLLAAAAPNGVRIYELSDDGLMARARVSISHSVVDPRECARYLPARACEPDLGKPGK
jgi:WD40 repeat protein